MHKRVRLGLVYTVVTIGLLSLGGTLTQNAVAGGTTPTALPSSSSTVKSDGVYFHPSALFSVPHFVGWDMPPDAEEITDPSSTSSISRAGATFINQTALSVVHVFVERDPKRKAKVLADLSAYYDKENLDAAWSNFTGGWKEIDRHIEGDKFVINFKLYLNNDAYLARQISQFSGEWLKVNRLVVPDNAPKLLDSLQQGLWNAYTFYPAEAGVPVAWPSIVDGTAGYIIRYPASWELQARAAGFVLVGGPLSGLANAQVTISVTRGRSVQDQAAARTWVTNSPVKTTIQTVRATTLNGTKGFDVSFTYRDSTTAHQTDSGAATLLNGANGTLYTLTFVVSGSTVDLLGTDPSIPPEYAQIRATYLMIPSTNVFVPTPASTPPPNATPTLAPTATLDPASLDFNTATLYKSDDGVLEIKLPHGWQRIPLPSPNGLLFYAFGDGGADLDAPVFLLFEIGTAQAIYSYIDRTGKVNSPTAALQFLIDANSTLEGGAITFSNIHAVKIGILDGQGVTALLTSTGQGVPEERSDIRLALLPPDKAVIAAAHAKGNLWDEARPIFNQMLDSVVIHAERIPTPTAAPKTSSTPTAEQTQIAPTTTSAFVSPNDILSTLNPPFVPGAGR